MPSARLRLPRLLAIAIAISSALAPGAPAGAETTSTEVEGYLELPDGTPLRYTALLPGSDGPFPVVLQYSGYNHGNDPYDGTFGAVVDDLLAEGIAVAGVNLRGSGCSGGTFSPFTTQWAEDGVEIVEWLAAQDWSDGNVAMAGVSYPAITALATAVRRPPSLTAVVATAPVIDLYRDVAWPGGAWNATFSSAWTLLQKYGTLFALEETAEGDLRCPTALPTQNDPTDITGLQAATHPYIDSLDRYTDFLMPEHLARIEAPTLVYTAWQDEQLGSRAMHGYEHLPPDRRWIVASNGDHIGVAGSAWYRDLTTRFLVHFLRGGNAGAFDAPRVQILREVRKDATFDELDTYTSYPVPTITTTLHAQPDGSLALRPPDRPARLTYRYPLPAPSLPVGIDLGAGANPEVYDQTFQTPVPAEGSVTFTTPALAENLRLHGSGSVDLWLSSTADDIDLQVTLTEVRPDGQELYVQRGWLRASHRELDPQRSTQTRPVPTHREADARPLDQTGPTPLRIELWPTDHLFRAGSSLRLYVEAPVGMTGFRQLAILPTPATNTIHVGPDTPTRIRFGRITHPLVASDRPACGTLLNQPCRTNPEPVPDGDLSIPGHGNTDDDHASAAETRTAVGPTAPLPATGGGATLTGLAALLTAAIVTEPTRRARRRCSHRMYVLSDHQSCSR